MKKISTLCLSLLCCTGVAQAQQTNNSFRFVEKQANGSYVEVPDGSVLNYTAADAEDEGFGMQIKPALFFENVKGEPAAVSLELDILSLNEGAAIQFCAAGACQRFADYELGKHVKNAIETQGNIDDMMLEYFAAADVNEDGDFVSLDGAASITLRADECEYTEEKNKWGTTTYKYGDSIGVGPQITINFNFNLTGIENVQNPDNGVVEEVARYNAAGQRVDGPVKGLNIVKLANGKTVKQLYK